MSQMLYLINETNKGNDMTRIDKMDILIENLGTEGAITSLVKQMSETEMNEAFEYICRMHEIDNEAE